MSSAAAVKRRRRAVAQRARAQRLEQLRAAEWKKKFGEAKQRDGSVKFSAAVGQNYRDAGPSRGYEDWWVRTGSADYDTLPDRDALVARSRDLFRNNSYARSIGHTLKREIVGRGMWPRPQRAARGLGWNVKRVRSYTRNVLSIWEKWAQKAYLRGGSIYVLQGMVMSALARDGECFVQFVGLPPQPGRPYQLAVDLIEAHKISTPNDRNVRARTIRDGIELNSYGQPVAVWVEVEDLAEMLQFGERPTRPDRSRWRRIPFIDDATGLPNIVHVRDPERPSTRSVPMLAGALDQVQILGEFIEAELHAKKAEGCIAAAITSTAVDGKPGGGGDDFDELEPGMIAHLGPGESINFMDPSRPGGSFGPFVEFMLRSISGSAGLPYEVCFLAFAGMNYSNARTMLLSAQRYFEQVQDVLIECFLRPTFTRLMEEAWRAGDLKVANWPDLSQELTAVGFLGQGFRWVDPEKEAKADVLLIDNKLTSRSRSLTRTGDDFEDVVADLVYEQQVLEEEGLVTKPQPQQAPDAPGDGEDMPDDGEDDTEDDPE